MCSQIVVNDRLTGMIAQFGFAPEVWQFFFAELLKPNTEQLESWHSPVVGQHFRVPPFK